MSIISPHSVKILSREEIINKEEVQKQISILNAILSKDWNYDEQGRGYDTRNIKKEDLNEVINSLKKQGWIIDDDGTWFMKIYNPSLPPKKSFVSKIINFITPNGIS